MHLIGAGLRLRADHSGAGDTEFGVVVGGRDLGLGHRFERRIDDDPAEHRVMIVRAVQQVRSAREALPVYQHAVGALRVLSRGGGRGCVGKQTTPGVINWKLVNRRFRIGSSVTVRDRVCGRNVAALRFQNPGLGCDLHRLRHLADFQPDIHADLRVHGDQFTLSCTNALKPAASTRTR